MRSPASAVATLVTLLVVGASPATAGVGKPSLPFPASPVTVSMARSSAPVTDPQLGLQGRGFGHGRGMSQWGARGAAEEGRTAGEILSFYYPGTTVGAIGNPTLRVRLTAMTGQPTVVQAEPGLTLSDGTCTAAVTRTGATWWRVLRSGGQWQVQGHWTQSGTAGWWPFPTSCSGFATASGLMFVGDGSQDASVLRLRTPGGDRDYRGGLRATIDNRPGAGQVTTVNHLSMDRYLQSVVPAEMPASWHLEALKAQSVAARSYGAAALGSASSSDICDTTSCQVYPGLTSAHPATTASNAAVAATTGQVLRYGTRVALTEFGSTNGGQVAGSSLPYQVAKPDPYDGVFASAPTSWRRLDLTAGTVERRWPAIGTFRSLSFTRDGRGASFGGRVTGVTLTGTSGTVTVTGEAFRSGLGLRSTYLATVGSGAGSDLAGNGFSDLVARDANGTLWNYPGNGRAGWLPRTVIATGWPAAPEILAPGDFSGDGIPDLLSRTTSGDLTLHRGTGAGKISTSTLISRGWQAFNLVLAPGDLDGDGNADLLARDAAGTLWLYRSNGRGGFVEKTSRGTTWGGYRELEAVGDFDEDGGPDLIGTTTTGLLHLARFSASGAFLGTRTIGSGWTGPAHLTGMGDVDGDGAVDLLTKDGAGRLWAYRGSGSGTIVARVQVGAGWSTLTIGS